jgi:hypothetical protein
LQLARRATCGSSSKAISRCNIIPSRMPVILRTPIRCCRATIITTAS